MQEIYLNYDVFTEIIFNLESDEILRYRTLNKNIEEMYKSNNFWKRLYYNKFYYIDKLHQDNINYKDKYEEEILRRNSIRRKIFRDINKGYDNEEIIYITSECFDILYDLTYNGLDKNTLTADTQYTIFNVGNLIYDELIYTKNNIDKIINRLFKKYKQYIPNFINIIMLHSNNHDFLENDYYYYLNSIIGGESKIYISPTESFSIKYDINKISFLLYIIKNICSFSGHVYNSYCIITIRKFCDFIINSIELT